MVIFQLMLLRMKKPKVSVVMPVYNGGKYIKKSVNSILNQSFKDFELIVINDGSIDETSKFLKTVKDKRLKVINNHENLGLVPSLNKGLKVAKGQYIARADADDINDPKRFEKQVNFLEQHLDYCLVGSAADLIDEKGKKIGIESYSLSDSEIRVELLKRNCIIHPTAMMRTDAVRNVGGYRNFFNKGAEEYDLWFRMIKTGKVQNLPEKLIKRRFYKLSYSRKNHIRVEFMAILARLAYLSRFKNLDLFLGIFTFLIPHFIYTLLMFQGRDVPPEPGDIYSYLQTARNIHIFHSFEQYRLLLFSIWLNVITLFTKGNFETAYFVNFFIGLVLLFLTLIYFLRKFESNLWYRIVILAFLGLFLGSGSYGGFYDVIPIFYLILFMFLLLAQVYSRSPRVYLNVLMIIPFFIFVHPTSIIVLGLFFILSIINFLMKRSFTPESKNSLYIFLIGLLFYGLYTLIGRNFSQTLSPESPLGAVSVIGDLFKGKVSLGSWPQIYREYFHFFVFNPWVVLTSLITLAILVYQRSMKMLLLFGSSVVLILLCIFIPFGFRLLIVIWPITFMILGYAIIALFNLLKKKFAVAWIVTGLIFVSFYFLATEFNLLWIGSVNARENYSWNRQCLQNIEALKPNYPLVLIGQQTLFAFQSIGLKDNEYEMYDGSKKYNKDTLFIVSGNFPDKQRKLDKIQTILANNITRKDPYPQYDYGKPYFWSGQPDATLPSFSGTVLDCGFYKVKRL